MKTLSWSQKLTRIKIIRESATPLKKRKNHKKIKPKIKPFKALKKRNPLINQQKTT